MDHTINIRYENADIIPGRMSLNSEIFAELQRADAARIVGNEGRARVCARRAAGMAAKVFLNMNAEYDSSSTHILSSYEAIRALAAFPTLSVELKQAVVYLTMPVTREFHFPAGIDLIDEAYKLIQGLK